MVSAPSSASTCTIASAPFMVVPARGCFLAAGSARLSFEEDIGRVYPGSGPVATLYRVARVEAAPTTVSAPPAWRAPAARQLSRRRRRELRAQEAVEHPVREPAPEAHHEARREGDRVARARPLGGDRRLDHARDGRGLGGEPPHRPLVGLLDLLRQDGV